MKKFRLLLGAGVMAAAAIALSSCSLFGPSTSDVQTAFTAFSNSFSAIKNSSALTATSSGYTETIYNGTSCSTSSACWTLNLNSGLTTATGAMVLTNYTDSSSGYSMNGSVSVGLTVPTGQTFSNATSFTLKMSGTVNYTGGTVNTLAMTMTDIETNPNSTSPTDSYTGTVTANGTKTVTY